jgi:heterodisulfide reductase subunit B
MSIRAVCKALGIGLVELEDWNCCGATAAYAVDRLLSVALPARNLAIAERENMDILAPCAACFHFLARANEMLKEKPDLKEKINRVLGTVGLEYGGKIEVRHPLDVIANDLGLEKVREKVVRPLVGLKAAPYYGCLFLRPPTICKFDNPENPQTLDRLATALGADCVPWREYRTRCCGGALQMIKEDAMLELSKRILLKAQEYGAECILTACPFCHLNLDMKQADINSAYGLKIRIPVLYFTQFLGLALGINPKELGLDKIIVPATKIVEAVTF